MRISDVRPSDRPRRVFEEDRRCFKMSSVKRIVLSDSEDEEIVGQPQEAAQNPSFAPLSTATPMSSSGRNITARESRKLEVMSDMKQKMGKGLRAAALSSDEEYSESSDDLSEQGRDEQWTFSARGVSNTSSKSSKPHSRGSMGRGAAFFAGGKSDHGDRHDDDDGDMDDFILGSDEEREEEEARAEAMAKARAKEKKARRKRRAEKENQQTKSQASSQKTPKLQTPVDSDGNPIRRILLDDDDDDDVDESHRGQNDEEQELTESSESSEEEARRRKRRSKSSRARNSKRRRRRSGSDSGDAEDASDESEESDDDAVDGPMLYWQVDAMREEQRADHDSDIVMQMRQSYTEQEAMLAYIELLARAHLNSDAIEEITKEPSLPANNRLLSASRQIENKICTMRESLLGSGAWAGGGSAFARELQCRPFYIPGGQMDSLGYDEKCAACNRTSKSSLPFAIYLFGAIYDAKDVWMKQNWVDLMPKCIFFHYERQKSLKNDEKLTKKSNTGHDSDYSSDDESTSSGDDDSDRDGGRSDSDPSANARCQWWVRKWPGKLTAGNESRWYLSGHCKGRTQLYHAMLHYKLRLLLKIRERLEVHNYSLNALLQDQPFINHETRRYTDLLELASSQFGGANMDTAREASISRLWRDGTSEPSDTPGSTRNGARPQSSSGRKMHQSGMLNFLVAANKM